MYWQKRCRAPLHCLQRLRVQCQLGSQLLPINGRKTSPKPHQERLACLPSPLLPHFSMRHQPCFLHFSARSSPFLKSDAGAADCRCIHITAIMSDIFNSQCADPIQMSQGDLITGLALAAATPIPFFIQVYICSRLRSFEGISFASLIMGNLCMSTQIVNAIALKWKQLQYCTSAGYSACQPSMVDLYQFSAVWLSFLPLIFQVSIASSRHA